MASALQKKRGKNELFSPADRFEKRLTKTVHSRSFLFRMERGGEVEKSVGED